MYKRILFALDLEGVNNVVGYSIGRAFIYCTPEYAIVKLPYQILQAVVGAVLGMVLCWKCGIYKMFKKTVCKNQRS